MKRIPLILGIVSLTSFTSAFAQIQNPDFGTDLSGWATIGDVAVRDGAAFLTNAYNELPGDDVDTMLNFSGTNVVSSLDVEGFSGLSYGSLDPDPDNGVFAMEGSALSQTFQIAAGGTIRFQWQFFTNETSGSDYAFVVINGDRFTLSGSDEAVLPGIYGYAGRTGVGIFESNVFATAQTVTLAFGVVDTFDSAVSSALAVDNVAVPEPGTVVLLGLALGAGGVWTLRRRFQKIRA